MTYTAANLNMVSGAPLAGGGQRWTHFSADAGAAVDTDGFFSDGGLRGLKVNDIVQHRDTGTNITTSHLVVSVSTTYPFPADVTDTTTTVSGTDSD
jgi:hypothetical protein